MPPVPDRRGGVQWPAQGPGPARPGPGPGPGDARDRALVRLGDDVQLVHDRVGPLAEDGVSDEAPSWLDLAGVASRVFAAEYAALEGRPRRNADAELASHRHELLLDGPLEQRVFDLQPDERGPAMEARRDVRLGDLPRGW